MSIENVKQFYICASEDEYLAEALEKINKEMRKENLAAEELKELINLKIIPLAKEKGFDFTAEDLIGYSQELVKGLSDEDLALVSGGIKPKTAAVALAITLGSSFLSAGVINLISNTPTQNQAIMSSSTSNEAKEKNRNRDSEASNDEHAEPSRKKSINNLQDNMKETLKDKKVTLPSQKVKNSKLAQDFADMKDIFGDFEDDSGVWDTKKNVGELNEDIEVAAKDQDDTKELSSMPNVAIDAESDKKNDDFSSSSTKYVNAFGNIENGAGGTSVKDSTYKSIGETKEETDTKTTSTSESKPEFGTSSSTNATKPDEDNNKVKEETTGLDDVEDKEEKDVEVVTEDLNKNNKESVNEEVVESEKQKATEVFSDSNETVEAGSNQEKFYEIDDDLDNTTNESKEKETNIVNNTVETTSTSESNLELGTSSSNNATKPDENNNKVKEKTTVVNYYEGRSGLDELFRDTANENTKEETNVLNNTTSKIESNQEFGTSSSTNATKPDEDNNKVKEETNVVDEVENKKEKDVEVVTEDLNKINTERVNKEVVESEKQNATEGFSASNENVNAGSNQEEENNNKLEIEKKSSYEYRDENETNIERAKRTFKNLKNCKNWADVKLEGKDLDNLKKDIKEVFNSIKVGNASMGKGLYVQDGFLRDILYNKETSLKKIQKFYHTMYTPFSRSLTNAGSQAEHLLNTLNLIGSLDEIEKDSRDAIEKDIEYLAKKIVIYERGYFAGYKNAINEEGKVSAKKSGILTLRGTILDASTSSEDLRTILKFYEQIKSKQGEKAANENTKEETNVLNNTTSKSASESKSDTSSIKGDNQKEIDVENKKEETVEDIKAVSSASNETVVAGGNQEEKKQNNYEKAGLLESDANKARRTFRNLKGCNSWADVNLEGEDLENLKKDVKEVYDSIERGETFFWGEDYLYVPERFFGKESNQDELQKIIKFYNTMYTPFSRSLTNAGSQAEHLLQTLRLIKSLDEIEKDGRDAIKNDIEYIAKQIVIDKGWFKSNENAINDKEGVVAKEEDTLKLSGKYLSASTSSEDLHTILKFYKQINN